MHLPGEPIEQVLLMILTGMVGIVVGLLISAMVKTSEMATSLVPLILIPQILFSGLVGVPKGWSTKIIGAMMPVTWSFDEMKRLSGLDTLQEEGADPHSANKGKGLYKYIKDTNKEKMDKARQDVADYKTSAEKSLADFDEKLRQYLYRQQNGLAAGEKPTRPTLGDPPKVPEAENIPDDLSSYVDSLHPWGNIFLNPIILIVMFFGLLLSTLGALRSQDIG
jgi:hypothetical protein